jgi:ABC-type sugar transport system permease subunit
MKLSLKQKKSLFGYLYISPWLLGFLLFFLTPILNTVQFSLNEVKLSASGYTLNYLGIGNFIDAFTKDEKFPRFLYEAVMKMITDLPVLLIFSLFAAVLLYKKFRGNSTVKTIFFLTVVLSSGVFLKMQADTMYVNNMQMSAAMHEGASSLETLQSFNLGNYLLEAGISPTIMAYITTPINRIFEVISKSGIQVFIFLAGLNSISPSIYEASHIEGATGWENFWKITFPMISPLILVNIVYTVIDSFIAYTNQALYYINQIGLRDLRIGYASALSWIYFVVIGGILGIIVYLVSKKVFYQT